MGNKIDLASAGVTSLSQVPQLLTLDPHAQAVAASLSAILGLGLSVWSYFSDKRNKELFDSDELVQKLVVKAKQSDDFASFVFDIWQKHNLESSDARRLMLKRFLAKEANAGNNQFENFSRIEHIVQNINLRALRLLSIIHSDVVQKARFESKDNPSASLSLKRLVPLVQSVENMHEQDIEYHLNELANYGLLCVLHGRWDGPLYIETELGFILLDYIEQ